MFAREIFFCNCVSDPPPSILFCVRSSKYKLRGFEQVLRRVANLPKFFRSEFASVSVFHVFVTQTAYPSRVPAKRIRFFVPFSLSDQQKASARLLARISYTIGIMSESNGTVPMDDDRGLFSPENVETLLQPTHGDDTSEGHEDYDAESVIVVGE